VAFDAVYVVHENPYTCGITRFSLELARQLKVPMRPLSSFPSRSDEHALLSLKREEIGSMFGPFLAEVLASDTRYSLFLHDFAGSREEVLLASRADRVIAANSVIFQKLQSSGIQALSAFCPGMVAPVHRQATSIRVLTFGMAHKLRVSAYRELHTLLEASGHSYSLDVSAALHEDTDLQEALFSLSRDMVDLFGAKVSFLGFLSDAMVSRELHDSSFFAAFFPGGARENNTSVLAAMAHGTPVITTLDQYSPSFMIHGVTVFDINEIDHLPNDEERIAVGARGREAVADWDFARLASLVLETDRMKLR
jgi:glycosyltransferase involved in cell wall biosynthesis